MAKKFGANAKHPLAGLASPSSVHPVAYAEYVAETLTPEQARKVHPTNALRTLFSLLAIEGNGKFDAAWQHWQGRKNVAVPFAKKLPDYIASSLGRITPLFFERVIKTLEQYPALAPQAAAGLRAGFRELAKANWGDSQANSQITPYTAEKALDYLTAQPAHLQFLVNDPAPLSRLAQNMVQYRSHPSHTFGLLSTVATHSNVLAEAIIDGAEKGKTAITDPCRLDQVERFISGLRRLAPAVPRAA